MIWLPGLSPASPLQAASGCGRQLWAEEKQKSVSKIGGPPQNRGVPWIRAPSENAASLLPTTANIAQATERAGGHKGGSEKVAFETN